MPRPMPILVAAFGFGADVVVADARALVDDFGCSVGFVTGLRLNDVLPVSADVCCTAQLMPLGQHTAGHAVKQLLSAPLLSSLIMP